MIGNTKLIEFIQGQIDKGTFPRFSIIVGKKGSGRKTLANKIFTMFDKGVFAEVGTGIADVREMIAEAHRLVGVRSVYLIPDADDMSTPAQNALLKVVEEPPNNAYFIMTLEDVHNVLETIQSRGNTYVVQNCTKSQIQEYAKETCGLSGKALEIVTRFCETIGEVNDLVQYGPAEFNKFMLLVADNIDSVSLANALKIAEKVAVKDEADKYSLKMFLTAFLTICGERMVEDVKYMEWSLITSKALKKLHTIRGINKQMVFDDWVFDVREWADGG